MYKNVPNILLYDKHNLIIIYASLNIKHIFICGLPLALRLTKKY